MELWSVWAWAEGLPVGLWESNSGPCFKRKRPFRIAFHLKHNFKSICTRKLKQVPAPPVPRGKPVTRHLIFNNRLSTNIEALPEVGK